MISVKACRDYTERSGHCICQCCETGFRVCMPLQYYRNYTEKGINMYFSWIRLRRDT